MLGTSGSVVSSSEEIDAGVAELGEGASAVILGAAAATEIVSGDMATSLGSST